MMLSLFVCFHIRKSNDQLRSSDFLNAFVMIDLEVCQRSMSMHRSLALPVVDSYSECFVDVDDA